MELVELLRRWERVGHKVTWECERQYETHKVRDLIVEYLKSELHHYAICPAYSEPDDPWLGDLPSEEDARSDESGKVQDNGWLICDWPLRLQGDDPEGELTKNDWAYVFTQNDIPAEDLIDIGVRDIVLKTHQLLPHVDTTPFVEFRLAAEVTYDFEVSGYFDPHLSRGKPLLIEAYKRALPVSARIQMLLGDVPGAYLGIKFEVVTVSRRGFKSIDLSPAESKLFNQLYHARGDGVGFKSLIPRVACDEGGLRGYLKSLRKKLKRIGIDVETGGGVWTLVELTSPSR